MREGLMTRSAFGAFMAGDERVDELRRRRAQAKEGGGKDRIQAQHAKGKLTARERLDLLLDPGSFVETDAFVEHRTTEFGMDAKRILGDGVVTGYGTIDGRTVFVFSQDFTVFGGSLGEMHANKIVKIMDTAMKVGAPVIGQDVSVEDLGGATAHATKSGVAHVAAPDEKAALRLVRKLLSYLPSNNVDDPPIVATDDEASRADPELWQIVPKEPDKPYDIRDVIGRIVDHDSWLEVHEEWAQNIVVGFARLEGRPVGVVGNP